jgi:hypothetical protein
MGLRIIIFYCFYHFLKVEGNEGGLYTYCSHTTILIILKIKEMLYQRNLTKCIKRYRRKNKKGCDIIVFMIELLVFGYSDVRDVFRCSVSSNLFSYSCVRWRNREFYLSQRNTLPGLVVFAERGN